MAGDEYFKNNMQRSENANDAWTRLIICGASGLTTMNARLRRKQEMQTNVKFTQSSLSSGHIIDP
jgi:hypothetical protein